jgi:hypothetical protein
LRSKTVHFSKQNTKSFKINSKEEAYNKEKKGGGGRTAHTLSMEILHKAK